MLLNLTCDGRNFCEKKDPIYSIVIFYNSKHGRASRELSPKGIDWQGKALSGY